MIRPFPDMFQQTEWASPRGRPNGVAHDESNGAVKRRRRKVEEVLDKPINVDAEVAIEPNDAPVVDDVIDPDAAHRVDDQAAIEPDATAAVDDEELIEDPDARRRVRRRHQRDAHRGKRARASPGGPQLRPHIESGAP